MPLIWFVGESRFLADAKKEIWCYHNITNRDNLAHLLPSFAQKLAVPTSFWAKSFKGPFTYSSNF